MSSSQFLHKSTINTSSNDQGSSLKHKVKHFGCIVIIALSSFSSSVWNQGTPTLVSQFLNVCVSVSLYWRKGLGVSVVLNVCLVCRFCNQEEMKAQLPRYQRLIPRPGQAHAAAPPVAAVGSIIPPQQGLPPQQPGMRHPLHGKSVYNLEIHFCYTFSETWLIFRTNWLNTTIILTR